MSRNKSNNQPIVVQCTLAEMIDNDILDHGLNRECKTDGFSLGKRGKARFYMFDPTPNGFYKIYEQDPKTFELLGVRYVDANKTNVTVWGRSDSKNEE